MRRFPAFLIVFLLFISPAVSLAEEMSNSVRAATIDFLMERAITSGLIEGGVAIIGNRDGILYTTARGRLYNRLDAPMLNERTLFDLASLTKVIATAPAIMKLVDEGRVSLSDPVARWFPEFRRAGRMDITILHLLTHTSGLTDFDLRRGQTIRTAIRKAAAERKRARPGTSFSYADINFILLGEIVHRASGRTLDQFCREEIFEPMGAHDTMFRPTQEASGAIAPTLGFTGGVVQDANSRRLGSVAGHAGLFSSADDLARFARLILGGGAIDGKRILSEQAVSLMTAPHCFCNGTVIRGLGWDIDSPFSAPRGALFSSTSFGHTGYSGTSIWMDPQRNMFVILLTTRLNYRDTHVFNRFRSDVSTIAAADFGAPEEGARVPSLWEMESSYASYSDLLHARGRIARPSLHTVRMAATGPRKHLKSYSRGVKRKLRKHHRKRHGQSRRA